jgi:GT2 family glycosyltransferase
MLFKSESYAALSGFDERYYLYVEDVDICTRIWLNGYQVLLNPAAIIIHNAQRASRTNWRHIRWHVSGLLRYFSKYTGRLPDICS